MSSSIKFNTDSCSLSNISRNSNLSLPPHHHPLLRLNAICPYYTMFPLQFPFEALADANDNEWVLDPFCGRGTTNFAARIRGLPSNGFDANPVAAYIAMSKFVTVRPTEIIRLTRKLIKKNSKPQDIPEGKFWDLCYHPKTLKTICILRQALLDHCSSNEEIALRALLLGVLHGPTMKGQPSYLSNQMPRTYATKPNAAINFWLKRDLEPKQVDVVALIKRRAEFCFLETPPPVKGGAYLKDSRTTLDLNTGIQYKWVVTSPPYFGMRTYIPDQWLRNWFVGGIDRVDYDQQNLITHHLNKFTSDLSDVWKNVADVCTDRAHLIVRFGALPSLFQDPAELLIKSLEMAGSNWNVIDIQPAGNATMGQRQSEQFQKNLGSAHTEIDLHSQLIR